MNHSTISRFFERRGMLRHWTINDILVVKEEKRGGIGPLTISWFVWKGVVDKSGASAPTYPRFVVRNSDLRSSCKNGKVTCWFYAFERSMLTDKNKEDCLRRWTLKWLSSDFCEQNLICELILALVSPWFLVNSFKETFKEKCPIDFFFIQRYFDYFIIIFPFFV